MSTKAAAVAGAFAAAASSSCSPARSAGFHSGPARSLPCPRNPGRRLKKRERLSELLSFISAKALIAEEEEEFGKVQEGSTEQSHARSTIPYLALSFALSLSLSLSHLHTHFDGSELTDFPECFLLHTTHTLTSQKLQTTDTLSHLSLSLSLLNAPALPTTLEETKRRHTW